jgi:hypothetical protein
MDTPALCSLEGAQGRGGAAAGEGGYRGCSHKCEATPLPRP